MTSSCTLAARLEGPVTLNALKASLAALMDALGHAQFEEHEMIAEGDRVMVRWTVRGVHRGPVWGMPATGREFALGGVNVFRVRDGLIVERRSYLDPADLAGLASPG